MSAKIGILVVHGMGSQKNRHFADGMIEEVGQRVKNLGCHPRDIAWQPVYWADILESHETRLLSTLSKNHSLSFTALREFVMRNLGDAVAYQREPGALPDVYQRIHARVREAILKLRGTLGDRDAPLIVMAHSLGSYIMSNYVWDHQRPNSATIPVVTPFERMQSLSTLITFGCNIALFSLALAEYTGITFPSPELPQPLRDAARWHNYLDPQDILAYPIKPLCGEYARNAQIEDLQINVGNLFTSWNPLSHDQYWTDNNFTEPVAAQIVRILKSL